jgi:hypothetical protein
MEGIMKSRMFRVVALFVALMTIGACTSKGDNGGGSPTQPTQPTPPSGGGGNPPQTSTATIRVIAADTGQPLNANVRADGLMKSEAGSVVVFENLTSRTEIDADAAGYLKLETRYYDPAGITLKLIPTGDSDLWKSLVFDNLSAPRVFVRSGSKLCLSVPAELNGYMQTIEAGAQIAQDAVGGLVSITMGSECDVPIVLELNSVNQGTKNPPSRDQNGQGVVVGGKLLLGPSGAQNPLVVAHEIIHIIGPGGHLTSGRGLMTKGTGDQTLPTDAEKRIFRYVLSNLTETIPLHRQR